VQNICRNKSLRDTWQRNKLFLRRVAFCQVQSAATWGKMPVFENIFVNSSNRQNKRNLLNFIRRNEGISTLEYKIYHEDTLFEISELKSLSFNELDFIDLLLQLVFFSHCNFLPQSKSLSVRTTELV
jgi:hypothetical protein